MILKSHSLVRTTVTDKKQQATESDSEVTNMYTQVDDFKWLKAEQSPNWRILDTNQRIADNVWNDIVPGGPNIGVEDILKAVGV